MRQLLRDIKQSIKFARWRMRGRPGTPPSIAKRHTLAAYAKEFGVQVFVETGTHRCETTWFLRRHFRELHTIEVEPAKVAAAKRLCDGQPHIHVYEGDSGKVLPQVLAKLTEPALFWLDGHYMDAHSGDPNNKTPASAELLAVLRHPVKDHVIVIDDASLFNGRDGYPSMDELLAVVKRERPDLHALVAHNSIRLTTRPAHVVV